MGERPVAIVTGASRGIGRAVALELASLGHDLVLNRAKAEVPDTVGDVERLGVRCEFAPGDIGRAGDRERLVALTRERFGRCDMLVNNAAWAPEQRLDILEAQEESFDKVLAVNLKGPYFLTQLVARWMIGQKKAYPQRAMRIVNIGSISAYTSSPSRGEYCISKAGVAMMTRLYADRLAEYGIGVFEIRPGIIETDMTSAVKDKYDKLIADGLTPIKRWGQPEDVARVVGAVAEGRFDFSTGAVLDVDGGFHLRRL